MHPHRRCTTAPSSFARAASKPRAVFCRLSEQRPGTARVGARHRAALGLTEQTDAVVLIVSEQTGAITIARVRAALTSRRGRAASRQDAVGRDASATPAPPPPRPHRAFALALADAARSAHVAGFVKERRRCRSSERTLDSKCWRSRLAIIGWAYFRFADNPLVATPQFQQLSIPIAAANLALGYVARFMDHEAVVTSRPSVANRPSNRKRSKRCSISRIKGPGVYNVPVQLVAPDVAVQSLSPASVTLTIEKIEQRSFPITVHYVGAQPERHRRKRSADSTAGGARARVRPRSSRRFRRYTPTSRYRANPRRSTRWCARSRSIRRARSSRTFGRAEPGARPKCASSREARRPSEPALRYRRRARRGERRADSGAGVANRSRRREFAFGRRET